MSAALVVSMRSHLVRGLATAIVCCALAACGGGTTGTSPTDSFKLIGITENSENNALPTTSMLVVSGTNDTVLVDSQTDSSGNFSMELPGDESSLIVDVQGTRSTPLTRSLLGSSIVSTKLSQDSAGALSFDETFEVQIDSSRLCEALEADRNQISWAGPAIPESCPVTFNVRTTGGDSSSIQATLRANCEVSIASTNADSTGTVSIDIAPALAARCGTIEITVSWVDSSLQGAVFPVFGVR